ncbi:gag-protease polyprotein [Tanacetum coccineum]
MASTRASISKASKRPKINIIPPKQLFVDLTQNDTKTPSPKFQNSSPSAPNAPSKTPSTKGTSSSSIDYIPKSPTSSTPPSPNGYLNQSTSPPPKFSPPPPTQENASMDITLTLSPNTPLDVQFDTPSPSPPIIAQPIPWNFLEAHDLHQGKFLHSLAIKTAISADKFIESAVIDVYSKCGSIEDAEHLIFSRRSLIPDARIWQILLSACNIYGNVDIGNVAARELVAFQPENESSFVLLSNLYASAGMWSDIRQLRREMRDSCL